MILTKNASVQSLHHIWLSATPEKVCSKAQKLLLKAKKQAIATLLSNLRVLQKSPLP